MPKPVTGTKSKNRQLVFETRENTDFRCVNTLALGFPADRIWPDPVNSPGEFVWGSVYPMTVDHQHRQRIVWGAASPRTLRVYWALHELNLDYESRPIGSRTGETQTDAYRALNPREKIPTLQDGDWVLVESAAIVTYLAETYGENTGLIPLPGTRERAAYFEWCCFVLSELDAQSLYVIRRHGDLADVYGEAPNAVRAAAEYFEKYAGVAERELADGRAFILGEQFTGADILLTSCLVWARFLDLKIEPHLQQYLERNTARPAYRAAYRANFPRD